MGVEKGSRHRRPALLGWGPGSSNLHSYCEGRARASGAFRVRPLPRTPRLPQRRACPRVCSHLAGAGESAPSCSVPRAGEVGAGGASAGRADISSGRGGEPHPANGEMAKNVEDLNKTACLSRAAAKQPDRIWGGSEKGASLDSWAL